MPASRGGRSSWDNTVTACYACNQRKADRTPHEAGMKLSFERGCRVRSTSHGAALSLASGSYDWGCKAQRANCGGPGWP